MNYGRRLLALLSALVAASVLLACGGGGSASDERDDGKHHFYESSFRSNQRLFLIAFDAGLIYGFYQYDFATEPSDFAYDGFFVARKERSVSRDADGLDFDFDAKLQRTVDLDITSDSTATFSAVIHADGLEDEEFFSSRAPVSDSPTDSSNLEGQYRLQARSVRDSFEGTAFVDGNGRISIEAGSNCSISVDLKPRSLGNLYDAHGTMDSACTLGSGRFDGHATQAFSTGNIYVFLTKDFEDGAMLLLVPSRFEAGALP